MITNSILKAVLMKRVLFAMALIACIGSTVLAQTYRPLTGTSLRLNSSYPTGGSLQLQANPGASYTLTFPSAGPSANALLSFGSTNGTMNFTAPLDVYEFTNGLSEAGSNTIKLGGVLTEPTSITVGGGNTLSIGASTGGFNMVIDGTTGAATILGAVYINATGTALTTIGNTGSSVKIGSLGGTVNGSVGSNDRFVVATSDGTLSQLDVNSVTSSSSWSLTGNTFTNSAGALGAAPSGSFLGNTGNASGSALRLVTDNKVRMIVATDGAISMGGTLDVTGLVTGSAGATISGGAVNLNASSNNAVNIGTGTSTGAVTIGGTGAQTIAIGDGAGVKTVNLGSSNTTSTTTILSGSGGANVNVNNNQPTNINTGTSTGTVSIGNASSTTTMLGTTNINATGSAATTIGNTSAVSSLLGGVKVSAVVATGATTYSVGNEMVVVKTTSAANINLPADSDGRIVIIKNQCGSAITVYKSDGTTSVIASFADGASATLISQGSTWYQIGN